MKQAIAPGLGPALKAIDERFWLRHGLFWLADFAFVVWFVLYGSHSATGGWNVLQNALLLTSLHMAVAYPLLYGVVPALWREDRRGRLLLLLAGWVVFSVALNYAHRYLILLPMRQSETVTSDGFRKVFAPNSNPVALAPAGVAACLRVYRHWRRQALANARLTRENFRAELRLLKAQLHPHFLFNTLNTLYALTLKQSDRAPEVVDRLTALLQAVVEQGNTARVALRDEVALLRDYVALEQLRYGPRLALDFRVTGIAAAGRSSPLIAPLLLLPLVENAFKHGAAEQLGPAHIGIALAVEGRCFTCVIANTKSPGTSPVGVANGIGLRNVQQRLRLLYPKRHRFEIDARDDTFTVHLTLQLPGPGPSRPSWARQRLHALTSGSPRSGPAKPSPSGLTAQRP